MATSRYIKVKEKNKEKDSKRLITVFVFLFVALGFMFAMGGFTYGRLVTAAILGLGVLLSIEDNFCLLCFCLPFASMLKLSQDSSTIIPIFYIIIVFKLMSREKMDVPPLSFFAFLLLAALQTFTIFFYDSIITSIFAFLLNVIFVFFLSNYFSSQEFNSPHLLSTASLCIGVSSTIMLLLNDLFPRLPHLVHPQRAAMIEEADRYAATVLDPNELSQLILIAICLLIAILPSIKSAFGKFLSFAAMTYMAITGIRTHSKSYVISILFLFAFLLFNYLRMITKKQGLAAAISRIVPIVFLAIIGGIFIINYALIPIFEARSTEQTDFFTGRTSIWNKYILALLQSPDVLLIGCGANNVTGIFKLFGYEYDTVPHNFYLEYVIQFGFGGLAAIFMCWKRVMSLIKSKLNTFFSLPLAAFLITAFGISVNDNDCLFILLALLSLPIPEELNQQVITTNKKKPASLRRPL